MGAKAPTAPHIELFFINYFNYFQLSRRTKRIKCRPQMWRTIDNLMKFVSTPKLIVISTCLRSFIISAAPTFKKIIDLPLSSTTYNNNVYSHIPTIVICTFINQLF